MQALTNLAYLMEGQTLYYADRALQYDKAKGIMFQRSNDTVWTFTNFCVTDLIKLSEKGLLSLTPDPAIWSKS
jgi:hypothetical protein